MSKPRSPRLPGLAGAFLGVLLGASTAVTQPDLRATTVNGPGQVYVDSHVLATIKIDNLGDPLVTDYVAEIVLSADVVVDASDVVVATVTGDVLGSQSVECIIPFGIPDVPHVWGLRVTTPGDSDPTNDWNVGPFVNVLFVDLALHDPSPIAASVNAYGDPLDPIAVTVDNVGTVASIVVFAVEKLSDAPWLTVDAPNSFAVGGLPGNDVFLLIDPAGLTPGVYTTTLRFQNSYYVDDHEDLSVTLTVGRALFRPGDKIFGQIGGVGDVDELEFDAVIGMKLVMRIRSASGDLKPKVSLIDPMGAVDDSFSLKFSKEQVKKVLTAKSAGRYVLRIEGASQTAGGYALVTHRKLPKLATMHVNRFKGMPAGGSGVVRAHLLPGGSLEYAIDPNATFSGPLALSLRTPSGTVLDLSSAMETLPTGVVQIEGIENVDECGCFELEVGGFGGGSKEKVKVLALPFQPQQGKGKIYID